MLIKKITKSSAQTQKLGEKIAKQIIRENSFSNSRKFAIVLALQGDLGAGKTTFLQGFARGLGISDKILSPTFVILKRFAISDKKVKSRLTPIGGFPVGIKSKFKSTNQKLKFTNFYHFDCYRINKPEEILELGWKEIISNPKNIVAIEWPEKIKKALPKNSIKLKFKFIDKNKREISFKM